MKRFFLAALVLVLFDAQSWPASLYFGPPHVGKIAFVYGEIEVYAGAPMTYFCGLDWSGEGANVGHSPRMKVSGGSAYCGIQEHAANQARNVIFTVWDTAPSLPAAWLQSDRDTVHFHAGPEDFEGGNVHTDRRCDWKENEIFRFALTKLPAAKGGTITTFYFRDPATQKWIAEASILNPPDARGTGTGFNVGSAFLEDFGGKNHLVPKFAMYRLWVGTRPGDLQFVRTAAQYADEAGSRIEHCGILNGSFFLAQGAETSISAIIERHRAAPDSVILATKAARDLGPVADWPLTPETVAELSALPRPAGARESSDGR